MATFKDAAGRDWILEIIPPSISRVRSECGVDLVDGQQLMGLADPVKLVDVLYVLCREQCQQRGLSDEDFGRGLVGESIEAAIKALEEAIADFFPPRKRSQLRSLWEKQAAMQEKMDAALEERMPDLLDKMEAAMMADLEKRLTGLRLPTDALESAE